MLVFDHIAILAATLGEGVAFVEQCLDHSTGDGGAHAIMGTHNRLSGLGPGEYLEVIAIDPDAGEPGRARWFDLDRRSGTPRIGTWVARTDDLDAIVARLPEIGRPVEVTRGELRWRMAVRDDGTMPFDGCFPALIEWVSAPPILPPSILRLRTLTLHHPDAVTLAPLLAEMADDPRINCATGAVSIEAEIMTPTGPRRLA